jgi:multisubunit Na+/H+ antiporter MnhG subunit
MLYGSVFLAVGSATTLLGPVGFFRDGFSRVIFFTIATGICSKCVSARGLTDFLFITW